MLQSKFALLENRLNLPIYRLSDNNSQSKSCFIDCNRIDTVRHFAADKKQGTGESKE